MFSRKKSTKKSKPPASETSSSPSSAPSRLLFPTSRSRPTSLVDTSGSIDIANGSNSTAAGGAGSLSSSPASSHSGIQASPLGKKTALQSSSVIDRLTSTQKRDQAAVSSTSPRVRTSSTASRSSAKSEVLPSLIRGPATLSPSQAAAVTASSVNQADLSQLSTSPSASTYLSAEQGSISNDAEAVFVKPMKKGEVSTASSLLQQLEGVSLRRKKSNASIKSSSKAAPPEAIPEETPQSSPVPVKSTTQAPLLSLLSDPEITKMIKQGAEAKVYISRFLPPSVVTFPPSFKPGSIPYQAPSSLPPLLLKHRFPKTYRHPTLSSSITSSRTIMEARALLRCARAGVAVPGVRLVDEREGILGLELIEGKSVREWLGGGAEGEEDKLLTEEEERQAEEDVLDEKDQIRLMDLIGTSLARMHEADIIHGDLTTSNMMLRRNPSVAGQGTISENGVGPNDEVVLIDFGLSSVSSLAEDKAVDLYVLERAFASTHPHSEGLYKRILESYAEETIRRSGSAKKKGSRVDKWEEIRRRLEEVRLRGRKRSMVGFQDLIEENRAWSWGKINVEVSFVIEVRGISNVVTVPLAGVVRMIRGESRRKKRSDECGGEGEVRQVDSHGSTTWFQAEQQLLKRKKAKSLLGGGSGVESLELEGIKRVKGGGERALDTRVTRARVKGDGIVEKEATFLRALFSKLLPQSEIPPSPSREEDRSRRPWRADLDLAPPKTLLSLWLPLRVPSRMGIKGLVESGLERLIIKSEDLLLAYTRFLG